jgi:hypothetical protein
VLGLGLELQQEFFSSRAAACRHNSLIFHFAIFILLDLSSSPNKILVCELLQVIPGMIFESPDKKTRWFLALLR